MRNVVVAGVGMTKFGRMPGLGVRSMATDATTEALKDAGIAPTEVSSIYFGNAVAGAITGQHMIRGQVAFRFDALAKSPLINVENACASGSSAFQLAATAIAAGMAEVVVAVGVEQLNHEDRNRPFDALRGSTDVDDLIPEGSDATAKNSILMDYYAEEARRFMAESGSTAEDFGRVAVKNRRHASMNPLAQFQKPQTLEEVMASRVIVEPLTLPMCSPTTDGAAVAVLCSAEYAHKHGIVDTVNVLACEFRGGKTSTPVTEASGRAYEVSGVGVADMDVIELHDAAAPAELIQYSETGLCAPGDEARLVREGITELGGKSPVNTSGGLLSRGHALGATGLAQIVEVITQVRGRAGERQVPDARIGMAVNGGGWMQGGYAVAVVTVLEATR